MNTRTLGTNGLTTSAVGLGCMGFSQGYGAADDTKSLDALHMALDAGVTFWDTAQSYGMGHNEMLLAKAIRGHRNEVQIATKVGITRDADGVRLDARPETIRQACENSLRRLDVGVIDLYYIHRFDPTVPVEDSVGAMADLVETGKILHIGLSECGVEQLRSAATIHPISALQCEWSLWWREPEDELIPTARRLGIGIVPYSPLGRGFLTNGNVPEAFPQGDFRGGDERFIGLNRTRNETSLAMLRSLATKLGMSTAQFALAWLLAQDEHAVPIPGTRKATRIVENALAADFHMSEVILDEIEVIVGRQSWSGDRRSFAATGIQRTR